MVGFEVMRWCLLEEIVGVKPVSLYVVEVKEQLTSVEIAGEQYSRDVVFVFPSMTGLESVMMRDNIYTR